MRRAPMTMCGSTRVLWWLRPCRAAGRPARCDVAAELRAQHARLRVAILDLARALHRRDAAVERARAAAVRDEVERHFAFERDGIFPVLGRSCPREVEQLLAGHGGARARAERVLLALATGPPIGRELDELMDDLALLLAHVRACSDLDAIVSRLDAIAHAEIASRLAVAERREGLSRV